MKLQQLIGVSFCCLVLDHAKLERNPPLEFSSIHFLQYHAVWPLNVLKSASEILQSLSAFQDK